jgi:secretion/DNA translocation related CpaE-like protein
MADGRQIVVVSGRDDVRSAVLRLGALAGAQVDAVAGSNGVHAVWRAAHVVVVGSDLAVAVAAAALPRRAEVVVVATDPPDAALWRAAVELGAAHVLTLPADERTLVELMSDALDGQSSGASVIAVVGGCGGAGASTLAAALALTSSRTEPTLLIDADCYGGGIDVLLGAEQVSGARWPDLSATRGRLSARALTEALVHVDGIAVLSWDRSGTTELSAEAAAAVMAAAIRGFRSVIVDLPRHLDAAATVIAAVADVVIVVVPATVRSVAAAATMATQLLGQCGQVRLVVRDARSGHLAAGEIAAALGLPVVAVLQSESAVTHAAERGEPPLRRSRGSLHDACERLLATAAVEVAA